MRKSGGLLIPLTLIIMYYGFWVGVTSYALSRFPILSEYFPIGGVSDLAAAGADTFEPVYSSVRDTVLASHGPMRLAFASVGALILTVPVSWVYFITRPVVVTGIAMIVLNSLALAFSLAGVVAAVRFRFSLDQPSDAMYIFVAIGIGLGSGIGALGVATVISCAFVVATLFIWKLEYGKTLSGPFLTMLTRRDAGEDDYE